MPFLADLNREERSRLRKLGHKNAFVEDCLRIGKSFPKILPPTIDIPALERDLKLLQDINDISEILKHLVDGLEDTRMLTGSKAMVVSDLIYTYLKPGAKQDANLKVQVEQMAVHYKKERKKVSD